MGNFTINGVNTGVKQIRQLQDGVTLEQVQQAVKDDGNDSVVFEQDGKAFIGYGDAMDFSSLKGLMPGAKVNATYNSQAAHVVMFENEVNSASEGVLEALNIGKKALVGGAKMLTNQGIQIVGAGMTLGAFARMGGAKVVSTTGQSLFNKAASFAFGPAKDLTTVAGKGLAKAGKWALIIGAGAAVAGTAGYAIYGASRSQNDSAIRAITR